MDEDRPLSIFPPLHVAGGRDEWFDNHHCRGIVRLANFLTVVMRTSVIDKQACFVGWDEFLWRWFENIFFLL